jgi:uracil-DNA glycosylase family 4
MSWAARRRNLLRKELACLEAEIALCQRCYGDTPRWAARFDRPESLPRILILGERPSRVMLENEERLSVESRDPATRFLRELLQEAGIAESETLLGAACLCRSNSRDLDRIIPTRVCVSECAVHVRELVRLAGPRLLVTLGAEAARSLKAAFASEPNVQRIRFPASVGQTIRAGGVIVRVAYQTTARARVTREEEDQRRDWREIGEVWRWLKEGENGPAPGELLPAQALARIGLEVELDSNGGKNGHSRADAADRAHAIRGGLEAP